MLILTQLLEFDIRYLVNNHIRSYMYSTISICLMSFGLSYPTSNARHSCVEAVNEAVDHKPWFGIEQEYSLMNLSTSRPLGCPRNRGNGPPGAAGRFYCGTERERVFGSSVVEAHQMACRLAGVKICGSNAELIPLQCEYQLGPCEGIKIADDMWMSQYILYRVAGMFNVGVSFDPKFSSWREAGAHNSISKKATRDKKGGLKAINEAIDKLSRRHQDHIAAYVSLKSEGAIRHRKKFSGVGRVNVSIRIPARANLDGYGYFEDRRPASNCDPYAIVERMGLAYSLFGSIPIRWVHKAYKSGRN